MPSCCLPALRGRDPGLSACRPLPSRGGSRLERSGAANRPPVYFGGLAFPSSPLLSSLFSLHRHLTERWSFGTIASGLGGVGGAQRSSLPLRPPLPLPPPLTPIPVSGVSSPLTAAHPACQRVPLLSPGGCGRPPSAVSPVLSVLYSPARFGLYPCSPPVLPRSGKSPGAVPAVCVLSGTDQPPLALFFHLPFQTSK